MDCFVWGADGADWRHPLAVFRSLTDNPGPGIGGLPAAVYLPGVALILVGQRAAATAEFIVGTVAMVGLVIDAVARKRRSRAKH